MGYDESNMHMASYDWRLPFRMLESRDRYFTRYYFFILFIFLCFFCCFFFRFFFLFFCNNIHVYLLCHFRLKANIELLRITNNHTRVALVAHSMGSNVVLYFLRYFYYFSCYFYKVDLLLL